MVLLFERDAQYGNFSRYIYKLSSTSSKLKIKQESEYSPTHISVNCNNFKKVEENVANAVNITVAGFLAVHRACAGPI